DEVAWASVEISGTKAYVRIVEKIKETEIADRKTPVDIIADNDGVILSIAASSGTPKVKEGDVVSKGDLLISSEIEIKENEEIKGYDYVAAGGSVVAKVVYPITSFISLNIKEKIYTGEKFKDTAIIFGNNTSNIFKPDIEDKYYDSFVSDDIRLKIGDYELPLGIKIYDYRVYYENERKLTEAEAEERLKEDIIKITEDMTEVSSLVLDVKEEYIREGDGLRLNAYVTVSEDIAVKDYNIRRSTLGGIEGKIAGDR
ncbi:MAG: sporulation protein YqfD, partial [Firmicutes bacterium]|nr:sporulation protein YqfD [Bacillota bacterium]